MLTPVFLLNEDGSFILTEDGFFIIVGYEFVAEPVFDRERPIIGIDRDFIGIGINREDRLVHSLGGKNAPARAASTTTMESASAIMESTSVLMGGPLDWNADATMKSPDVTEEKPRMTIDREFIMMDNPFGIPD